MKNIILFLLVTIILMGNASAFVGGDGSVGNPYQVATLEDLQQCASFVNKHYIQMNDIDATPTATWNSNTGFMPISIGSTFKFTGSYDGQNHTIDGLFIGRTANYQALFGYTDGATIKNLKLTNVDIRGGSYTGGLVGYTYNTKILNVGVEGSVETASATAYLGGLGGYASQTMQVKDCYFQGDVISTIGTGTYLGGLFGRISSTSTVDNCYSAGTVVSSGANTGGLLGYMATTILTSSYYDTTTSGRTDSDRGTPKTTAEMQNQSTFTGWDFTNIWEMDDYPVLRFTQPVIPEEPIIPEEVTGIYSGYLDSLIQPDMGGWDFVENGANFYINTVGATLFWIVILSLPYISMYNRQNGVVIVALIYLFSGGLLATVLPAELSMIALWMVVLSITGLFYHIFISD